MIRTQFIEEQLRHGRLDAKTLDNMFRRRIERGPTQGHRIKIGGLGRMANSAFGGKLNLCGTSSHLCTRFVVALVVDNKYNIYVR